MARQEGQVIAFDPAAGSGLIGGADGRSYRFAASDVSEPRPWLGPGVRLAFEADGDRARSLSGLVPAPAKDKIAAGLLAIILGGLGVHKFYLGRYGAGAVMLAITLAAWIALMVLPALLFVQLDGVLREPGRVPGPSDFRVLLWLLVPALILLATWIVAVIEGIIYLSKDAERFHRDYVAGRRGWF